MFNTKASSKDTPPAGTTIIGAGTTINGDIQSNGDIRVDGILVGNLTAGAKIIIGSEGVVEGNLVAQQADILGKITGTISVKDILQLRGKCVLQGDIYAAKLQVEPSATFNGNCNMGANVVE